MFLLLTSDDSFTCFFYLLKFRPKTDHEGPEGRRGSSTLSLTSTLVGWMVNDTPWPLYPREKDTVPIV